MSRNKLIITWEGFLESVQNCFGSCKYEDPQGALSKLLQKGTVTQYESVFEKLMNHVINVSEGLLISFYISSLKPAIQRELLVSKPISLGDAFSLACVTKARLDDQAALTTSSGLKGDESLGLKRISLHHMQALLEADDVYGVYEVHRKGVKIDPKKVAAVMEWHVPTMKWHIRGFLGLTGLSEALILGLPNFKDMFIVEADASDVGIGAVLMDNGKRVYKWRQYLLGRHFIIRTDHRSIKELMQHVIQIPLQQKYLRKLMGFDFAIEYKTGNMNLVADALSRMYDEADDVIVAFMALSQPLVSLVDDLRKEVNDGPLAHTPLSRPLGPTGRGCQHMVRGRGFFKVHLIQEQGITLRKMSAMANTTPIVTTVTKAATKEKTPKEADATPRINILDFCEEHYEDILPAIMDKIFHASKKKSILG
ncbi:hypothetical protein Tco_0657185 [Tanacetum coccineum]|uniref:Reverse transcriptase RNase H-like domain-containing protein n=1 Tax=Tanacetum coccineum TaxID=301880 RepID=A0ABQ4XC70_9ASTR